MLNPVIFILHDIKDDVELPAIASNCKLMNHDHGTIGPLPNCYYGICTNSLNKLPRPRAHQPWQTANTRRIWPIVSSRHALKAIGHQLAPSAMTGRVATSTIWTASTGPPTVVSPLYSIPSANKIDPIP